MDTEYDEWAGAPLAASTAHIQPGSLSTETMNSQSIASEIASFSLSATTSTSTSTSSSSIARSTDQRPTIHFESPSFKVPNQSRNQSLIHSSNASNQTRPPKSEWTNQLSNAARLAAPMPLFNQPLKQSAKTSSDSKEDEWGEWGPPQTNNEKGVGSVPLSTHSDASGKFVGKVMNKPWTPTLLPSNFPKDTFIESRSSAAAVRAADSAVSLFQTKSKLPLNPTRYKTVSVSGLNTNAPEFAQIPYRYEPPTLKAPEEQLVDYGVNEEDIIVAPLESTQHTRAFRESEDEPDVASPLKFRSLMDFALSQSKDHSSLYQHNILANESTVKYLTESALFGTTIPSSSIVRDEFNDDEAFDSGDISPTNSLKPLQSRKDIALQRYNRSSIGDKSERAQQVHLNMTDPFSILVCGASKSGTSHTLQVLVENCLLPSWNESHLPDGDVINTTSPMCALVLHYSPDPDSLCQFTNLTTPLTHVSLDIPGSKIPFLRNTHMVVLVSPSSYVKRREQYKSRCEVRPLLFSWENMTTHQISLLLQLPDFPDAPSTQLLQPLLSTYEKTQEIPTFQDFIDIVNTTILPTLSPSDTTSFTTRLTVLETFIAESPRNRYRHPTDFAKLIKKGVLIVADLTASGMQPDRNHWTVVAMPLSGVNAVCEVLLDLFAGGSRACRRVVVVDDVQGFGKGGRVQLAVKGLVGKVGWTGNPVRVLVGVKDVGEIVDGIEGFGMVVVHQMRGWKSVEWVRGVVPVSDDDVKEIFKLGVGDAVVFVGRHGLEGSEFGGGVGWKVGVRVKFTS